MTKITDVKGRIEYISRTGKHTDKAEELVMFKDDFKNWDKLVEFEKGQARKTLEARELMIALPNNSTPEDWEEVANMIVGKQPHAYAVHWNEDKTNLHMHLIFSERQETLEQVEPKRYRQDIWAKEDGSRAMKKEDRHHIMHKKGDVQRDKNGNIRYKEVSGFSEKDKIFKSKAWLESVKKDTVKLFNNRGYSVKKYDPKGVFLAEKHEGKGNNFYIEQVKAENIMIRNYNAEVAKAQNVLPDEVLIKSKEDAITSIKMLDLVRLDILIEGIKYQVKIAIEKMIRQREKDVAIEQKKRREPVKESIKQEKPSIIGKIDNYKREIEESEKKKKPINRAKNYQIER